MLAETENARATVEDDAITGGLLHDIGLLVLVMNMPKKYRKTRELMRGREISDWEAEREVLGSTPAEVGAYLVDLWGLSDGVVEAVAFNHAPRLSPGHGFSALTAVHVANCFDEGEQAAGSAVKAAGADAQYLQDRRLAARTPTWRTLWRELSKGRRHLMVACLLALSAAG